MVRFMSSIFFIILFAFVIHLPSMDARSILRMSMRDVPSLEDGIDVSGAVIPKGPNPVPSSSGAKATMEYRMLATSAPSPGVGHHY
ncbi:hypothetical protein I3843_12G111600 [Carya illinoinensis]|uniref:Uncharacterized protein n=1 Tax=Carya illinoinensis TaxID=32201 RepID=A0A922IXP0_CARIL|nr:hypothetical protein I3842_12G111100 [Carya illinoinensis]KAG6685419.1 hypothetical protein I3842_12G111100 [Carya illinoinensis]KAG7953482.1 hypothetical protein I3843_12G111600 [Carya illinoinensis]KAG7953483.1 hypothetical protein I3843_12G111600 [Carya illinoinensis]